MILVNGKEEQLPGKMSLAAYAELKEYRTDRIAAELNGQIIPKRQYEETLLQDGDKLEIVSFVGGG